MLLETALMRLCLLLGFWLSLASGAELPEQVQLRVHTFPASKVYLESSQGLSFVGNSGQLLTLKPPALLDSALRPIQYANGFLVLKAPHHADRRVPVSAPEWTQGTLPAAGSFQLSAESPLVTARDYFSTYPLASAGLLVALLLAGVKVHQWRRGMQQKSQENLDLSARLLTTGDPLLGKRLGNYRVMSRLGQGGMGSVYRVTDPQGGEYAAKVIYFEDGEAPELKRFRREFKVMTRLQHPTLLRAFDYGEEPGMAYCISELVSGKTLDCFVTPDGLPWSTIWPWVRDILEGLSCAHKAGVVHRDLKPSNIMIFEGGVKILDFGLARQAQITAVTLTGQAMGTPTYMAPEQVDASGTEVDVRSDLYSLGIILYELLSGSPPFVAAQLQEVIAMHLTQPPAPLSSKVCSLPAGLEVAVATLLAKKQANRYATAERVLEVLAAVERAPNLSTPQAVRSGGDDDGTIQLPGRPN